MNKKVKLAGLLMIIAGIGGFIFMTYSYLISILLFVLAGIIGLFLKNEQA